MKREKDNRKKNKRQKEKRAGRIEKREKNDLKIYSPTGQLIFVGKPGFSLDYQNLLIQKRRKSEKSKYRRFKGVF